MRIEGLDRVRRGDRVRVHATFRFEACDLPDREVFVEGTGSAAEDLEPSADAFLLMGLPLACWMGEHRVRVDGAVCTRLRDGLGDAMRLYADWYEPARPVEIEARDGFRATTPRSPRRTAALLTGGVDSLATFKANRDAYPLDHPDAIREAILLRGVNTLDFDDDGRLHPAYARAYEEQIERLHRLGREADFELTVLDTNVRLLSPTWEVFQDVTHGAALLAPAQMLRRRMTDILIGSPGYGTGAPPHGSHPGLDPLYSTSAVRVHHELPFQQRLDKLRLVAAWPEGLRALDVCLRLDGPVEGTVNCGRCHKCVRTMLGLVALGRLEAAETFPPDDVTVEMVEFTPVVHETILEFVGPLPEPLERAGCPDLAEALRRNIRRFHARRRRHRRVGRAIGRVFRRR